MKKTLVFVSLLICFFVLLCSAQEQDVPTRITSLPFLVSCNDAMPIKVLLSRTTSVTITTKEHLNVYEERSRAFLSGFMNVPVTVTIENGGLSINGEPFTTKRIFLLSPLEEYTMNGKTYRGALKIVLRGREFLVVNEVPLETYVKGVLPSEMYSKWPAEALKAQAVATRTYAVFSAIERNTEEYHVSDSTMSQVYGGQSAQVKETDAAVEATRGEVLTYAGEIFPAYFHSTCGGHTTNAEYVWDVEPHPALTGVKCPFCWESKYYTWNATVKVRELEKRLWDKSMLRGSLLDMGPAEVDTAGRALSITLKSSLETTVVNANELRVFVLPDILKSTAFTVERTPDAFLFKGRGWGHGAGMCQWGANKMAVDGYDYKVIVGFYYPRAVIEKLAPVDQEYYDLITCDNDESRSI